MARAPVSKTGGWGFESLHSCQVGIYSSNISMRATKRAASLAPPLWLPQQLRQLGDVGRDLARFLAGEQLCCRAPARLILEIHVGKRLAVAIPDDDTGVELFGGPWREKKAVGHDGLGMASSYGSECHRSPTARPQAWTQSVTHSTGGRSA